MKRGLGKRTQNGASIVEAALTLPIMFLILFGILMFGRAFNIYQTITDAAREGARFSTQPCSQAATALDCSGQSFSCTFGELPSSAKVQSCVQRYLSADSITSSTINVNQSTPITVNGAALKYTSVQVTVPFNFIYLPFGTINLTTQAVMRNETN
jgi:Flp pilus assembly protein TadG